MTTIGTLLGTVPDGETLAGWEIIATGDGGAITMKTGTCWGRYQDWQGTADDGWDAVTARLWARLTDEQVLAKLAETRRDFEATARIGPRASYEATYSEAARRGLTEEG